MYSNSRSHFSTGAALSIHSLEQLEFTMSMPSVKLYRHALSGHSHRVELLLSILKVPTQLIDVDLRAGAHKQPDFLAMNAFGQVPVLDDNGAVLADSNAALVYLARTYGNDQWLPADPARVPPIFSRRRATWLSALSPPSSRSWRQ